MDPDDPTEPTPPVTQPGWPPVTVEDPSGDGFYCGKRRSPTQIRQAVEGGDPNPWPYCRLRAGYKTDHPGVGICKFHGGNSPGGRAQARMLLSDLVQPAVATLARAMASAEAPWHTRVTAARDVLDRTGYPRRLDVDLDSTKDEVYGLLLALADAEDDPDAPEVDEPDEDDLDG